jgi:hypothetical protein
MIMNGLTEGVIARFKREERDKGIEQGIVQGERNIIRELLKNFSVDEVSCMIHRKPSEIRNILGD